MQGNGETLVVFGSATLIWSERLLRKDEGVQETVIHAFLLAIFILFPIHNVYDDTSMDSTTNGSAFEVKESSTGGSLWKLAPPCSFR